MRTDACTYGPKQQFTLSGAALQTTNGECLEATGAGPGEKVRYSSTCSGGATQRWERRCAAVCAVDTILVVDRSGSIGSTNWREMVKYMKSRVAGTNFTGPTGHRIGIVGFASSAAVVCPLSSSGQSLLNCIDGIVYTRGGTSTHVALELAGRQFLSSTRLRSIEGVWPLVLSRSRSRSRGIGGGEGSLFPGVALWGGGVRKPSNDPRNNQHSPRYANYWAPLPHKWHPPQPAQPPAHQRLGSANAETTPAGEASGQVNPNGDVPC